MSEIVMIVGCPASGKGALSKRYIHQGYVHLNRDAEGGKVISLLPKMEAALRANKNVVLDNTFPTIQSRAPFVDVALRNNVKITCIVMNTSIEDAQINALGRMYERYGKILYTQKEIQEVAKKDPNIFPPAPLFKYRKEFECPKISEGFFAVTKEKFTRILRGYLNKAIILDYDGTLRVVKEGQGNGKYPTKVSEVEIMKGRKEILEQKKKEGYLLLGVSNQSGIAKGTVTEENAIACFEYTNQQLGLDIDYHYCAHRIPPMTCYCRKPQSGFGVMLIEKYKLDVSQSIMVGDSTSDKTFAKRLGFRYEDQAVFFK